jgi:hypothetical protein
MALEQQEYTPIDPAFAHFYDQSSAQPTVPQQQIAQQPVPAAKRNVQIPADALAGIQFKAPDLGVLKGTDPAPIKAKVGKGDVPGRDTSVQQAVQQRINANPNAFFFK